MNAIQEKNEKGTIQCLFLIIQEYMPTSLRGCLRIY